jgi:hypothetical protein
VTMPRRSVALAVLFLAAAAAVSSAETLPSSLRGTWRIARILPTTNQGCWTREQAGPLVGSSLTYRPEAMRWRGGEVALHGIAIRTVSAADFSKENTVPVQPASFSQLGIHADSVLEVDLQHEDADVTGASTEVPGDSVLLVSPRRIVVSACGVYYEAVRAGSRGSYVRASTAHSGPSHPTGR